MMRLPDRKKQLLIQRIQILRRRGRLQAKARYVEAAHGLGSLALM
jgi:hypothetical protein